MAGAADQRSSRRHRARRWWLKPVLLVASVLVALVLAEGATRVLFRDRLPPFPERALWRYDEVLGWSHPPRQRTELRHRDYRVTVETNDQGLRDRSYPFERGSARRLLLLGDSYAWGLGVEQDEIFLEILERRHPDWEMINAGVSGYGTDQELLYFRERGRLFRPDVVLLLVHPNDLRNNAARRQQGRNKPRFVLREGQLELATATVPRASFGQQMERLVLRRSRFLGLLYLNARSELRRALGAETEPDPELTAALISELAYEVEAAGGRLLVAVVPMAGDDAEALESALSSAGVTWRSLADDFARARERELEHWQAGRVGPPPVDPFHFEHDRHWNPLGHRVAAEAVESFLIEEGVLAGG